MRGAPSSDDRAGRGAMVGAVVAASVLRLVASVGHRALVYVDSIDYEHIDWWGGRRPWVTPVLYELFDDHRARVFLQAGIGAACWAFLAVQAAALVEDRRARWGVLLGVLGLSLTTSVTNWDTTMLSESLALSLVALLLGVLLRLGRAPSTRIALVVVAVWTLWLFTRQAHLILSGLGVAALVVAVLLTARRRAALAVPLAIVLAGVASVTLVAAWSYRQDDDIAHDNLTDVVARRIYPDEGDLAWFVDHGMPLVDGALPGRRASFQDLRHDPDFERWLEDDAVGDYARFLLTHPWGTLTRPFEDMVSERAPFGDLDRPDDVLLAMPEAYGVAREVLPLPVEDLLFDPGQAGGVLLALAVALTATAVRARRTGLDGRWVLPLVVLALQWPALVATWHTSTVELGRLGLPSAVLVRVAVLVQLGLLVDAWLTERRPARPLRAAASIL